ncbi:small ribosomal subunit Rsm22 family protein [uncultured Bartonella sp.]|uniref:small ribosomal subunit Rsm22 family protein n=1 Tax=uncultured Bartonella sp. TaxID=104108 RepID=UPI0025EA9CC8|nr:small ribosomal subunit Rsm22 family protein [uncultured Bartonella sp.]
MQLPANLRSALDEVFEQTNPSDLEKASSRLTRRYRDEVLDGKMHIGDKNAALGYIAARFPATYGAVYSALDEVADMCPSFLPSSQLDVGAGPGTAVFAASRIFPSLKKATLVEQSNDIIAIGKQLFSRLNDEEEPDISAGQSDELSRGASSENDCQTTFSTNWQKTDISALSGEKLSNADLVTASYVLDELQEKTQDFLVDRLWEKTLGVLLLVEPGTPAGFKRLMRQRQRLLEQSAHILAPCPHELACPVQSPDWCHFSVRVERSRMHKLAKQAVVPFEDEKYCYLAVTEKKPDVQYCRILSRPQRSSGRINISLCLPNGEKNTEISTKKNKTLYSLLRRLEWGSRFENIKP